jgi:type IV secretory pathway protease TraF
MKHSRSLTIAAALAAVILILAVSPVTPVWIRSESLPQGLYLATRFDGEAALARNQLACFPYENPSWAAKPYLHKGELLCKHVYGLPGDTLTTSDDGTNEICHGGICDNVGTALKQDSRGRPVHHPVWTGSLIPEGSYYLGSTRRPNSLDSRYLGLIPKNKIVKTLVPLLVEQDN